MATKQITVPDFDWAYARKVLYVLLATWVLGVRMAHIDPFDDIVAGRFDLGVVFDLFAILGVYLLCWHVMYPNRPKIA